jgi:hypothetical protein
LTILGDDPAKLVDGILLLNVHRSNEDVRNCLGLHEGKGKAIAEVNVFQHEVQEEIWLHQGSLVIAKDEGLPDICQPAVLIKGFERPFRTVGEDLGHPRLIRMVLEDIGEGLDISEF